MKIAFCVRVISINLLRNNLEDEHPKPIYIYIYISTFPFKILIFPPQSPILTLALIHNKFKQIFILNENILYF